MNGLSRLLLSCIVFCSRRNERKVKLTERGDFSQKKKMVNLHNLPSMGGKLCHVQGKVDLLGYM